MKNEETLQQTSSKKLGPYYEFQSQASYKKVEKTKYLGVQIDKNFDWKAQIKAVSPKVSRATRFSS